MRLTDLLSPREVRGHDVLGWCESMFVGGVVCLAEGLDLEIEGRLFPGT